jgi:nitroimidazol reductase NimA-like FMN-containing flavoprotein (pyridoxamine 5'-phosphate oxidase superfamily)
MRRNDRAINIEEARSLLELAEYGVLSMACPDGVPRGILLNFSVAGDCIYFHCAPEGKKIEILLANTRVSFCVVGNTTSSLPSRRLRYWSVANENSSIFFASVSLWVSIGTAVGDQPPPSGIP